MNSLISRRGSLLRGLLVLPLFLLGGCDWVLLNPSGDIAAQQGQLIVISVMLMMLVIVPVIALTVIFAWRYRKNNTSAEYDPEWDHSTKLELIIWGGPLLIIIVLGLITWVSTHQLDPYRPLDRLDANRPISADAEPLTIEVVALDWKWLFIYPEQGIATVNELATPVDVPVRFKLTSSTVMNSFYIPELAGQIYTMAGMETQLNAVINKPVESEGFSANYSGEGFSHMRFKYHGMEVADFDRWVKKVKTEGGALNRSVYLDLEKPSKRDPVTYYKSVPSDLYGAILNRCVEEGSVCMDQMMRDDARRAKTAPRKGATQEAVTDAKQESHNEAADHTAAHSETAKVAAKHSHSHKD